MKLDRNLNATGRGKYALLKLRRLAEIDTPGNPDHIHRAGVRHALRLLQNCGILDYGDTVDSEFFVIRLKDRCARGALETYAHGARFLLDDPEYAAEIDDMARRSGPNHPNCKDPD